MISQSNLTLIKLIDLKNETQEISISITLHVIHKIGFDFPKFFVYNSIMRIFLTSEMQTVIEGVCINDMCISKEEMLQTMKSHEGLVYRKFIDIALKSDVTMQFVKQVQNHIERLARIADEQIDADIMANTMACIYRQRNNSNWDAHLKSEKFSWE